VVATCITVNILEATNGAVLGIVIPAIAEEFRASVELAAWVQLAPGFASAMLGPSIGKFADMMGRVKTWWIAMFFMVLSFLLCANATSIGMLVAARTLGGLSWAGTGPSGFAIMADKMPADKRGLVSAWQSSSSALGGSVSWHFTFRVDAVPVFPPTCFDLCDLSLP
jgi:MFS family permease